MSVFFVNKPDDYVFDFSFGLTIILTILTPLMTLNSTLNWLVEDFTSDDFELKGCEICIILSHIAI